MGILGTESPEEDLDIGVLLQSVTELGKAYAAVSGRDEGQMISDLQVKVSTINSNEGIEAANRYVIHVAGANASWNGVGEPDW